MNQLRKLLKRAFHVTAACRVVYMLLLLLMGLEGTSLTSYIGFPSSIALTAAWSVDLSIALPIGLPMGLPIAIPIAMLIGFPIELIMRPSAFLVAQAISKFAQHDCEVTRYGSQKENVHGKSGQIM